MATKVSRKQLIKGGAGAVLALGALAAAESTAADGRHGMHVHIHGQVKATPTSTPVAISIDVAGSADDLAGAGWDGGTASGPTGMVPGSPVGACYYTAAGTIVKEGGSRKVVLDGMSLFNNRPLTALPEEGRSDTRADGRLMHAEADLDTGEMKWSLFAAGTTPSFLTGVGTVVVTEGSHTPK